MTSEARAPRLTLEFHDTPDPEPIVAAWVASLNAGRDVRVPNATDEQILLVRLLVVQGKIPHDAVVLLHAGQEIRLNARGVPLEWPKGVFGRAARLYAQMRTALTDRERE